MLWNRKTFQFLFSVFPLPWFVALQKMPQYVPLHMPGGQRQNTEWERLQRHKQTLQVLERQILPLPRFLSSLHFFQNVIDVLKFKFESLGSYSLLFFCISNFAFGFFPLVHCTILSNICYAFPSQHADNYYYYYHYFNLLFAIPALLTSTIILLLQQEMNPLNLTLFIGTRLEGVTLTKLIHSGFSIRNGVDGRI